MKKRLQRHSEFPRGKVLFEPFKLAFKQMMREFTIFFLVVIVCAIAGISIEISENVTSFETKLFWFCIVLNAFQIVSSIILFKKIRSWEKWIAIFFTIVMIGYTFGMFARLL
jgi:hypothetical protein